MDLPRRGISTRVVRGAVVLPADRNSAAKETVEGAISVTRAAARVRAESAKLIM